MSKKFKLPELTEEEMKELAQACRFAFGNDAADEFFDEVMAKGHRLQARQPEREQKGQK